MTGKQFNNELDKKWENQIVKAFKNIFGEDSSELFLCNDPDKFISQIEAPYFWVNTSLGKDASLETTLKKGEEECEVNRPILAICQEHHEKAKIAMYLDDFLNILKDIANN